MDTAIVRTGNAAYSKYEELLIRRDEVSKQAYIYEREYVRTFGDLILEVFNMKIEAIRKKKTIRFCQIYANKGQKVDRHALEVYLAREMAEYRAQLARMVEDNENAKKSRRITEADLLRIKRIYRHLVKRIHPDINPATNNNVELRGLWQRMLIAYNCNDLKEMEEIEVLVSSFLEKLGMGTPDIDIPDIEEKMIGIEAEIRQIRSTDPYQFKYLLEDASAVEEKKAELRRELEEYEEYGRQLDQVLKGLMENGVTMTWQMN